MQSILRDALDEQLTDQQLRQRAAQGINDATRNWKVTRQADARPLPRVAWATTIADVARSIHDPERYCEQVKQWARQPCSKFPLSSAEGSLSSDELKF